MSTRYEGIPEEKLILRDLLAAERTVLAAERTFLAYIRTAIAFLATGASFVRFFGAQVFVLSGWLLIAIGLATSGLGIWRFCKTKHEIGCLLTSKTPNRNNSMCVNRTDSE